MAITDQDLDIFLKHRATLKEQHKKQVRALEDKLSVYEDALFEILKLHPVNDVFPAQSIAKEALGDGGLVADDVKSDG